MRFKKGGSGSSPRTLKNERRKEEGGVLLVYWPGEARGRKDENTLRVRGLPWTETQGSPSTNSTEVGGRAHGALSRKRMRYTLTEVTGHRVLLPKRQNRNARGGAEVGKEEKEKTH